MQLRETANPLDRATRNDINWNWNKISDVVSKIENENLAIKQLVDGMEEKVEDLNSKIKEIAIQTDLNTDAINKLNVDGVLDIINVVEQQGNDAQIKGNKAKQQGDKAEQQGLVARDQGNKAKGHGDYAKKQGDYAKEQGDYANEKAKEANKYTSEIKEANKDLVKLKAETIEVNATVNSNLGEVKKVIRDGKRLIQNLNSIKDTIDGWRWRGEYNDTRPYYVNNIVYYKGSSYIAVYNTSSGISPETEGQTAWQLMAKKGMDGSDFEGVVTSVNGKLPDEHGNVTLDIEGGATEEQLGELEENLKKEVEQSVNTLDKKVDKKLENKVDKVEGKGLSTYDFDDTQMNRIKRLEEDTSSGKGTVQKVNGVEADEKGEVVVSAREIGFKQFKGHAEIGKNVETFANHIIQDYLKESTFMGWKVHDFPNEVHGLVGGAIADALQNPDVIDKIIVSKEFRNEMSKKVDKRYGYDLSKNDFTDAYKLKLDHLEVGGGGGGSGGNVSWLELQPILDNKVDTESGKGLSTNDFTNQYRKNVDWLMDEVQSGNTGGGGGGGSVSDIEQNGVMTGGVNSGTAFGYQTQAISSGAIAAGNKSKASGTNAIAMGSLAEANGSGAVAIGTNAKAKSNDSVAMLGGTTTNTNSVSMGRLSQSTGANAFSFGESAKASANVVAMGKNLMGRGLHSTVLGRDNSNDSYGALVTGYGAVETAGNLKDEPTSTNDAFIIGNHAGSGVARSSAFRVRFDGNVYTGGSGKYNTGGADYAEMFEWQDGNPKNEDRRGLMVTLVEGDKIKVAEQGDEILGVISSNAGVIGNNPNHWNGIYEVDEFEQPVLDETGNFILSKNYDETKTYTPRSERQEWGAVGLLGQLHVRTNGEVKVGDNISVDKNGFAKTSKEGGMKVLRKVNDNIVVALLK